MDTSRRHLPDSAGSPGALPRLFRASPFVAGVLEREREWADQGLASGEFALPPARPTAERLQAALADVDDEAAFMRALRRFRNRELARIAFREVAGCAELDETLQALSDLADAACASALDFAARVLRPRHGIPRAPHGGEARPIVLGLGKLGGRELNFSSDIDLIFAYTASGETEGPVSVSNEEYFARLAQTAIRLLSAATADGFVFRVDTLLRPFGSAGALAMSADAMESYYQQHGREWERYALVKARPIAGDLAAGRALRGRLEPFVYRRYLDFDAIGALRELKILIDRQARQRGAEDDLKLGTGGIRELEFIVQLFQLVRGGQDARLRSPHLRQVLRYLGEAKLLPRETAQALDAAYVFLRRCENAIQMYADEQTHRRPRPEPPRAALCAALDFGDWAGLCAALDAHRARVRSEFERVFARDEGAAQAPEIWLGEAERLAEALRQRGYARGPRAARALGAPSARDRGRARHGSAAHRGAGNRAQTRARHSRSDRRPQHLSDPVAGKRRGARADAQARRGESLDRRVAGAVAGPVRQSARPATGERSAGPRRVARGAGACGGRRAGAGRGGGDELAAPLSSGDDAAHRRRRSLGGPAAGAGERSPHLAGRGDRGAGAGLRPPTARGAVRRAAARRRAGRIRGHRLRQVRRSRAGLRFGSRSGVRVRRGRRRGAHRRRPAQLAHGPVFPAPGPARGATALGADRRRPRLRDRSRTASLRTLRSGHGEFFRLRSLPARIGLDLGASGVAARAHRGRRRAPARRARGGAARSAVPAARRAKPQARGARHARTHARRIGGAPRGSLGRQARRGRVDRRRVLDPVPVLAPCPRPSGGDRVQRQLAPARGAQAGGRDRRRGVPGAAGRRARLSRLAAPARVAATGRFGR